MKPVFKCDYCSFIGTEKEVKEHEPKCYKNYDRQSCYTCEYKYAEYSQYICKAGKTIPENSVIEFCDKYKRKEKSESILADLMDAMFKSADT